MVIYNSMDLENENERIKNVTTERIKWIKETYYSLYQNISKRDLIGLNKYLSDFSYNVEKYYKLNKMELKYEKTLKMIDLLHQNYINQIEAYTENDNCRKYYRNIYLNFQPLVELMRVIEKRTKKISNLN